MNLVCILLIIILCCCFLQPQRQKEGMLSDWAKDYIMWRQPLNKGFTELGGCTPQGLANRYFTYPHIDPFYYYPIKKPFST